jgi:hypothetical protein
MAPSVTSAPEHVQSAPDQTVPDPASNPAPNKKKPPRSTALADAKKVLRAASAATSKSLAAPEFVHRPPDIARHRRKCAVCHHPERELIEDLFIHWHSPNTISEYYKDDCDLTWVSIYRHAYAFGLDELRRRNLRFAFELIIEQAADIHATPAAIIASARALGTCVSPDGQWNDPPKRILVTNIVKHDSPEVDSAPTVQPAAPSLAPSSETSPTDFLVEEPPAHCHSERVPVPSAGTTRSGVWTPAETAGLPQSENLQFGSFKVDSEIRNGPNSFKSKEPPISNR